MSELAFPPLNRIIYGMSATEVIQEIRKLTQAERREVHAYLTHQIRSHDPVWKNELARRIDEARAGHALTSAEVQALVARAQAAR